MIEIGRLCIKTAGRDAGCHCVVIGIIDDRYVMIDGETRRRKCNIAHLEPKTTLIKIEKNASHEQIKKEFENLGLKARETNPKTEKPVKPVKQRKKKEKPVKEKSTKEKTKKPAKEKAKKETKPKKASKK